MFFPFTLSLVFTCGLILIAALLALMAWRSRNPREAIPEDLPVDPAYYGPAQTNRWLRFLRLGFVLALMGALVLHGYWIYGAPGTAEYELIAARDQRERRLASAGLRGWVFDRTGSADRALVRYRLDNTNIVRHYTLGEAAVNVTGYSDFIYGSAGIERAYDELLSEPASISNALVSPAPVGKDVQVTIDAELQRHAYTLLKGKRGAAVVLAVPSGEVLAMASSPSFDPSIVNDENAWKTLKTQAQDAPEISPLTDRALKTYYLPGSTFKVLVTIAALESGMGGQKFTCSGGGYFAPNSRQQILDDSGGGHGQIGLADALRVSCNQYFAQMGGALGTVRLAEVARRLGIETERSNRARDAEFWRYAQADRDDFVAAFAPPPARVVLPGGFGKDFQPYDLAIESFGQGPNQMTIIQLARIAAAVAGPDGRLAKPRLEADIPESEAPEAQAVQVCSAETAAAVREMMRAVVDSGTAAGAFASLRGRISAGGKTGTAQRIVTVYDPRTGKPKVVKNRDGEERVVREESIDALFIGFAPYENPQIAFAMIVENGGHGGTAAAPIAVGIIQKAAELGIVTAPQTARPPARPEGRPAGRPAARPATRPAQGAR
jgi:cell division protein FtsI/penicillin-binding protein 2